MLTKQCFVVTVAKCVYPDAMNKLSPMECWVDSDALLLHK